MLFKSFKIQKCYESFFFLVGEKKLLNTIANLRTDERKKKKLVLINFSSFFVQNKAIIILILTLKTLALLGAGWRVEDLSFCYLQKGKIVQFFTTILLYIILKFKAFFGLKGIYHG